MQSYKIIFAVIFLAMATATASAQQEGQSIRQLDLVFDIQNDLSVRQEMDFAFSSEIEAGMLNYSLDQQIQNVEVFAGEGKLSHHVEGGASPVLQIFVDKPTTQLSISFTTRDAVFSSNSAHSFLTEVQFGYPVEKLNAKVKLPRGFGLQDSFYRPADGRITSDGTRVILEWERLNLNEPMLFAVVFKSLESFNIWVWVAAALGIAAITAVIYFRKKASEEFLKGFREDQKKVIQYMEQRKTAFQRDIQKEFQFSRAKATRVVKSLEEKGLIRKEEQGRTNKIFWLK